MWVGKIPIADPDESQMPVPDSNADPIVITGIGLVTANGFGREAAWQATKAGITGIRRAEDCADAIPAPLTLAASVDIDLEFPHQHKSIRLARLAAEEAMFDSGIDLELVDRDRFACAVSSHFGDIDWYKGIVAPESEYGNVPFIGEQWLSHGACCDLAHRYGLNGPRFSHATACASGLIDILCAVRSIRDGMCDVALAGCAETIEPLCAAGFDRMRVLAKGNDPKEGCLPFDARRQGFVIGEGAGMFIIERLSHAVARGATIYAEIVCGKMLADAYHVTSLNTSNEAIVRLIQDTVRKADLEPSDIGYINAHGTGTAQNDALESSGIREAFGVSADDVCVSSLKSMLGHLVNASGGVELALSVLGMRDGFAPPTVNLEQPDPACDLDFIPTTFRANKFQHAMKLSLAFGGHLVAAIVRRWNNADSGFAYPDPLPTRRAA